MIIWVSLKFDFVNLNTVSIKTSSSSVFLPLPSIAFILLAVKMLL
ncbi:MAG: hypothetical protein JWP78_4010 [Mucilaginibacter sp.]|nr:hypothetical protein [Mucilaginibacter sp.]